jgi:hypothetical protein
MLLRIVVLEKAGASASRLRFFRIPGVARQSLYDRLSEEKLTPTYWYNDLRFLRNEIEA